MAIYHFSMKVVSRANGSSAVAAAAYRSGSRLEDERLGRAQDFSAKSDVVHSEVMLSEGAPERWLDRERLWNEVEGREGRKDAQLAREVEFSIPREMDQAEGVRLAREFVQREFVNRGMVADLNMHWDRAEDGSPKPHAHVMLTMRSVKDGEFGPKVREWNATSELQGWRERWAEHVNGRLAELGIEARVDHRSYRDQGIALEPQNKIGPAGARREGRGEEAERADDHRSIARRNGEKLIADPSVALDAITRQQSTLTERDLQAFVFRNTDGKAQFDEAMSAARASPELVALGQDGRGRERFTTREMLEVEARLERAGEQLAGRRGHDVSAGVRDQADRAAQGRGLRLSEEQRDALGRITGREDIALVVGYAGTGKSAMLGVAREAWEAQGYTVRGAALSGIAAENLEGGSAIPSRTIASLEHAWGQERDPLTSRDVLVIDEAGMIGSRQLERVLSRAERAGAKVVLVGDPEQLQAIEAGAAFRALAERHGAAEITEVRRQREDWQRAATRELATGGTAVALERYEAAGMVTGHATHEAAREAVVAGWDAGRRAALAGGREESRVILAHTRADVAELNQLARGRMREAGALGEDQAVTTGRGERAFAEGDRVMFLRNERGLGVKNGSLGQVEVVTSSRMAVRLDDGRQVAFDLKDYADIDHGYAATIHKAQGVTVDRAHVLASSGLDRHAAYVALTRHREGVELHYGADQFADRAALARTLGRERAKDTTLDYPGQGGPRQGSPGPGVRQGTGEDYARVFAERRDIFVPEQLVREVRERVQAVGQAVSGWVAERADVVRERAAEAYRTMKAAREGAGALHEGSAAPEPRQMAQAAAEAYRAMKAEQRQNAVQTPGVTAQDAPAVEAKSSPFAGLKLKRGPAEPEAPAAQARDAEMTPKRSPFDGLKLKAGPVSEPAAGAASSRDLDAALERYGRARAEEARMAAKGYDLLPHQITESRAAREQLNQTRPHAAYALDEAMRRDPRLIGAGREGRTEVLKAALAREEEMRVSPNLRAERFVKDWMAMKAQHRQLGPEAAAARKALEARMGELAGGLKRDPQLESLVRTRAKTLGVSAAPRQDLGQALVENIRPGRSKGLSR
jgi:Ti-type conjugative transfer relaxase TraA